MNNNYKRILAIILLFGVLDVGMAGELGDVISDMEGDFEEAVKKWMTPLQEVAEWILFGLCGLGFLYAITESILKGDDFQGVAAIFVRYILVVGFFLFLIREVDWLATKSIEGWEYIGKSASGDLNDDFEIGIAGIFDQGMTLFDKITKAAGGWSVAGIASFFLACVVVILYSLITAQAFFVMAELWVVTAAGVVLLGFGGNPWTGNYAQAYLRYWIAVGVKVYILFLVVSVGSGFIHDWADNQKYSNASDIIGLIGIVIIIFLMVKQTPDMVQGLISGASLGHATPSVGGMAKTAAKVVGGAAMGAAGAGMAMSEAAKAASADGKTAADNRAGAGISSQLGKFDSAVEFGANMAGHLGASAGRVTAGKLSGGFKSSGGTLGGSMAHDIRMARQSTKQGQIELAAEKARESMAGAGSTEAVADLVGDFAGGGITGGGISGGSPADSSGSELAGNDDSQHSGRTTNNADPGVKSGVISPALQAKVDGMSEGDQEKFQQVKAMADKGEGVSYPSRQWLQEKGIAVSELYDTGEGRKKTPQQGFQMQRVSSDDSDQLLQEWHRQGVSPAKQSAGMGGAADKPIGSMAGGAIAMDDAVDMPAAEQGTGFVPEDYDDYAELAGADLAPPDIDYMDSGLNEPPPLDDGWFDALDDDSHSKPKAEDHSNRE